MQSALELRSASAWKELLAEFDRQADGWESFGRRLCGNFIEAAERVAVTA